jgi:type I restriction enzyme S subunit
MSEPFTLTGHNSADGELPKGWRDSSLGEVAKFLNGRAYKKDELLESGKYRVLRVGNFFSNNSWYWSDLELEESKYCDRGDLLYAWSASFGPRIWDGEKVIFHYHIWRIVEDRDQVDKTWLRHWLDNDVERIKAAVGTGTTMMHVTKREMEKRAISIPSHAEQERIVEILEEQLSRLDTALESVRVVREKAEQFRRSLLHAAFTGTLTGHNRIDWANCSLGELATINYGYTESASDEPIGPKFLRITDLRIGGVSWNEVPFCLISATELEKHRLADGDIVFARTGATTGKSFLVKDPPESVCASYLIRLQPNCDLVDPNYLNRFFQSDEYWAQIHGGISGTAQGGFNATKLSALVAPIPPLLIQHQIVQELDEQLSRLDAALAVADAIEKRSAALRRSLLHAAFTGRLTEQWRESVHV